MNLSITHKSYIILPILLISFIMRQVFYTGFMGSDEFVYNNSALGVLSGEWPVSNYIGALRYGVNIPVAFFMSIFGISEWSANLWSLSCSLGEILVVYLFALNVFGTRAAFFSACTLAILPLHVNFAGRMMADAPLSFFISLSFYLFYRAEQLNARRYFIFAGIALGCSYWIKDAVAILSIPAYLLYALIRREFKAEWLWVVSGFSLMVLLNMFLMWKLTGNPLYLHFRPGTSIEKFVNDPRLATDTGYYFKYLFIKIVHTWLLGPLALFGLYQLVINKELKNQPTLLILSWLSGLIATLTFTIISFNPLTFIFKQTNYMLVFAAPLSILCGYFFAKKNDWQGTAIFFIYIIGCFILSALEQQSNRIFVSNSKAAAKFAQTHKIPVYGSSNNSVISEAMHKFYPESYSKVILPLNEINALNTDTISTSESGEVTNNHIPTIAYVNLDTETMGWGKNPTLSPNSVPKCWIQEGQLEPIGFGYGENILFLIKTGLDFFKLNTHMEKIIDSINNIYRPSPSYIYAIPLGCKFHIN